MLHRLPLIFAAWLTVGCLGLNSYAADAPRPNVVIIFADDQGYGDLGVNGATGFQTPNIDRIANEGMRFTDFYVAQAVCSASRTALLTGCYPNRVGILGALGPSSSHGIHDDETTLGELFRAQGYATAIYGKWHLGHHPQFLPTRHGFDDYFGLPYSNDMWPKHPTAKGFPPLPLISGEKTIELNPDQTQLTTWYAERAVKFIEANRDRPFFLYVPHAMPHVPLFVSDKFRGKTERGLFGDVISEIDWCVGEILAALKKHQLDEKTLVIYTSDNGPWLSYGNHGGSAGPLREGKGTSFDGGVRVPCVMRWPGKIPAGKVCREPAMTIDLFPTLAGLVGGKLPARKIDGLDIWPLMSGQPDAKSPHEAFYFYWGAALQAVRSGNWKLHFPHPYISLQKPGADGQPGPYANKQLELSLFNLADDIGEAKNVAAENPEVVAKLQALAEQARADLGDTATKREGAGVRPAGRLPGAPEPKQGGKKKDEAKKEETKKAEPKAEPAKAAPKAAAATNLKRLGGFVSYEPGYRADSNDNAGYEVQQAARLAPVAPQSDVAGRKLETLWRRPVALAAVGDALYVANTCGTISQMDVATGKIVAERKVGKKLSDLAAPSGGAWLLATDEAAGELIALSPRLEPQARLKVPAYPVSVVLSADARACYVASLWPRQWTAVEISQQDGMPALRVTGTLDLPFAPRKQLRLAAEKKLLVADSFGGQLAEIDLAATPRLAGVRQIPAHNIRGLAVSPTRRVLLAHQILSSRAETTHNDIHWGILMTNLVRWLDVDRVLAEESRTDYARLLTGGHVHLLGEANRGAGDPAGVAISPAGRAIVCLAGVDEVAVGDESDYTLQRLSVGKRPTAVTVLADGQTAAVANTHSDSVSLIDLAARRVRAEYALGPMAALTIAEKGEVLFHSARMSMEGWMSCHSCHTDGHTNGQLNDNFSDGSFGTPKRILSLHGTGMSPPWAWNGEKHDLDGQILQTIRTTMLGPDPPSGQVESLAMYLRTLEAPPALDRLRGRQNQAAIARGAKVFRKQDCAACHVPSNAFTSGDAYDVGLADEAGLRRYNPPALEGVSHRGPYLHDGRAKTVEEIFTRHRHPSADVRIPAGELSDLAAYLRSL